MTTAEFIQLLKNPNALHSMSYEALDQLLLQHPYCNGIRMLLLKKYKNDDHNAFQRHLALASMYATDRGKLYDFLNSSKVANAKIIDIRKAAPDTKDEKKTKIVTELIAPPPVYHTKVSKNPPVMVFQKPLQIEELPQTGHLSDNETDTGKRSLGAMPIEEWLQDFKPPRIEEKPPAAKKGFKLSRIPVFEKGMLDFLESETENEATKPVVKAKKKTPKIDVKEEEKEKEIAPDFFPELEVVEEKDDSNTLEEVQEDKVKTTDVFDMFLSQTDGFLKSIGDKKTQGTKDELEWEDNSTNENEEVASETLADLLAKQGQKSKAIKMYESLSLKFPEKNRLFADKITELKG